MATFAEYPAQTMASNDFTLYPYQEPWRDEQAYLPTTTFPNQPYLDPTALEFYQNEHAYVPPALDQFAFKAGSFPQPNSLQPPSPTYSPAHSASNSFDFHHPPVLSSTSDSGASVQSTISSAMGSPSAHPQSSHKWTQPELSAVPRIVHHDSLAPDMFTTTAAYGIEPIPVTDKGCVDPALIQPMSPPQFSTHISDIPVVQSPQPMAYAPAPSPAPSQNPSVHSPRTSIGKAPSPYARTQSWNPYPPYPGSRRHSISSVHSRHSQGSLSSEDSNKGPCPIPTCGRHVKDLKAHMLTHQNERPEKCPIPTCEYHIKGFARKYDKNRHTLTHYKGTMVCGFCPGSGSSVEKSFNRADVFKRHLTSVHGVEQTPPNARRKSPTSAGTGKRAFDGRDASGMCSTCGVTFASAQDFYEHLDDCVLRVVQQVDPSEAINEKLLSSVADDKQVQETIEKHMLPTIFDHDGPTTSFEGGVEEEAEEDEDADADDAADGTYGSRSSTSGKGSIKSRKATGNAS